MIKLNPNERLLIESGMNHYRLIGPGRIWLKPWQKSVTRVNVGPQGQSLQLTEVRTVENIPVDVTIQVIYQIDPLLFSNDLLTKVSGLSEGGWQQTLRWRTEQVVRQMLANYSWRDLGKPTIQKQLERRLRQILADYLKIVGLNVKSACLIKTELPDNLQRTIIQTERDSIEPSGRASVLVQFPGSPLILYRLQPHLTPSARLFGLQSDR